MSHTEHETHHVTFDPFGLLKMIVLNTINPDECGAALTERRLHSDGRGLLRLLAEAKDIDGLDTKHVGLSWDQAVHHKPETHHFIFSVLLLMSLNIVQCFYTLMEATLTFTDSRDSPGVFERFVVTREPLFGSNNAAVNVISHQVFQMLGSLPLHKH